MKKLALKSISVILCSLLMIQISTSIVNASGTSSTAIVHWGYSGYNLSSTPGDLINVKEISAGYKHALALKEDGTVVAWGSNESERINVPADLKNVKAISAGFGSSLALKEDGTIVTWGSSWLPKYLKNIKDISAGKGSYSGVVKEDGTVQVWGYDNEWGQLDEKSWLKNAKDIEVGSNHIVVLREDGTVVAWGDDTSEQTRVPAELNNVKAIAAGYSFSVALKEDGTVVTWGKDLFGKAVVPVPEGLTNVKAISAGSNFVLALKEDGTVVAWGGNYGGQTNVPQGLTDVKTISAGRDFSLVFVQKQDYTAPTGIKGVPPTSLGGNDGRIVEVTTLMEYRRSTDISYTKVNKREIRNLSSGTYYVRNAAIPGYSAGEDAVVIIPSNASAEGYTYTILRNEVTITGYTGLESDIAIPADINGYTVTSIGESAFENKTSLKSITFPNRLTSIEKYTFYGSNIKSLSFPMSLKSIGSLAFAGMNSLTEVWFYGNAPVMGDRVFGSYNNNLEVYYEAGKTGYTNPWYGYSTKSFEAETYTVSYNKNGSTAGIVPIDSKTYLANGTATVLGNSGLLSKAGYNFSGWNTRPDGTGINYSGGDLFNMGTANIELYAKWTDICDINKDDTINILDLAAVALNYNTRSTEANWNSILDLNNDNIVDIFDLVLVSKKI